MMRDAPAPIPSMHSPVERAVARVRPGTQACMLPATHAPATVAISRPSGAVAGASSVPFLAARAAFSTSSFLPCSRGHGAAVIALDWGM